MTTRHKWADVAIAFAEGKKIQFKSATNNWSDWETKSFPSFNDLNYEYRIKPAEPVVRWLWAYQLEGSAIWSQHSEFMTEKYAENLFNLPAWKGCKFIKIEATRTEFPSE